MRADPVYLRAIERLRQVLSGLGPGEKDFEEIVAKRDTVLARYGPIFNPQHIPELTAEEFRSFLYIDNNRHWSGLYRTGLGAIADMSALRRALSILLDEDRPIAARLDESLGIVRGLGKAIGTAVLTVAYPTKYGV